jgi:hypothetical protein
MLYFRFQNDTPKIGEVVHCWTDEKKFRDFVRMMKRQDPQFLLMKFWEITGTFIRPDDGDALVRVQSARQIQVI